MNKWDKSLYRYREVRKCIREILGMLFLNPGDSFWVIM